MTTEYHAKLYAHELRRRHSVADAGKLAAALLDAQVDLNPHQVEAALFAFKSPLSKGAILADEVGLGKTIEAGLVLAQKWTEGRRRILIITPANLRKQWSQELAEKFFLPIAILESKNYNALARDGVRQPFEQKALVICSFQFAARHSEKLMVLPWDLVVIDEAHRLRNVYRPDNRIGRTLKTALSNAPKLLQKAYFGRIAMIYIDPPYNTGGEFIYPDKYAETLETYLAYTGQIDAGGRRFSTNTETTGRYHSRWLNMMYPRLYLARNLLRKDGLMFISIDDNEVPRLRELCDHVFGEENFVSEIVWKKAYGGGAKAKYVVGHHEYVLCYARDKEFVARIDCPPNPETRKYYKFKDEYFDTLGPYRTQPLWTNSMDERENLRYPITKDEEEIWPEKQWQWERPRTEAAQRANKLEFIKSDRGWSVYYKQYLYDEDGNERSSKLFSVLEGPYTQAGTDEIEQLFGDGKVFSFPKPSGLIEKFIATLWNKDDAIVLDFFAGSCATAQAVMQFNEKEGKKISSIMVQLPEPCDENSVAYKAGFRNIAQIGRERIRRAAKRISSQAAPELNFNGSKKDLGFKTFKLDRSNFKVWEDTPASDTDLTEQIEMHVDHLSATSSPEDVLYELLLKAGFALTTKVKATKLAEKEVFSIEDGALLICLEKEITSELIDALAEANPLQVICLDEAFKGNDQLKANAVQTFRARAEAEESEIVFRTV